MQVSLQCKDLLYISFLSITLLIMPCGGDDGLHKTQRPNAPTEEDINLLRKLVNTVKTRISFGKDVAIYKWVNGEPILDKTREKSVMESVAKMASDLGKQFGDDEHLFFIDLMEATKLIEYSLVSDWYASDPGDSLVSGASLTETRNKITAMQADIIDSIARLQSLKTADICQEKLAEYISSVCTDKETLTKIALQRAFGNFCKKNQRHNKV